MVRRTRPGISRFRVRVFDAPRNDDTADDTVIIDPVIDPVIPGWSVGPDPESRDSGFAASRLGGDLRARQHPCDFLAAVIGGERVDAGGDALALVERVF